MSSISMGPGPGHFAEGAGRPLIVVLDDYEDSLRRTADWSASEERAELRFHTERLRGDALLAAVEPADAIVVNDTDGSVATWLVAGGAAYSYALVNPANNGWSVNYLP